MIRPFFEVSVSDERYSALFVKTQTAMDRSGDRRPKKMGEGLEQVTVFRCAVCKKDFKSQGQMANHETSKAHKKKMEVGGFPPQRRGVIFGAGERGGGMNEGFCSILS